MASKVVGIVLCSLQTLTPFLSSMSSVSPGCELQRNVRKVKGKKRTLFAKVEVFNVDDGRLGEA